MKSLSQKAKIKFTRWIKQRDGPNCFYCEKPKPNVLEHLVSGNRGDVRLEVFVLAHQSCNVAKEFNTDWQVMASEKLKENERALFIPTEDNESEECSTEIKISKNSFDITEQYLSEKILTDNSISWHDALYGSVYQCKKKTGYGSVQCIRNYLYILTSPEAPFMKTKNDKKKPIIVRRNKN